MTPPSEPTLGYKGGGWSNSLAEWWVRNLQFHCKPAHYSGRGLSFRTRLPMRLVR